MYRPTAALVVALTACASSGAPEGGESDSAAATTTDLEATTSPTTVPPAPTIPDDTTPEDTTPDDTTPGEAAPDGVDVRGGLPDPEFAGILRIQYEHVIGGGPGLIESELGYAPLLLEPGSYRTDAMWTPLTFTAPEPIRLISERRTFLVLVDEEADGLWDVPIVHVMRPHRLVDPAATTDGPPEWPATIDGWDLDAWFTAQPGIDVERTDVTVGGIDATRYDVTIPDDGSAGWQAEPDVWVVPLMWRYGQGPFDLPSVDRHRLWLIPQGVHTPIVIHAAVAADEGWGGFGDELDSIIASIELGEPEPVGIDDPLWEAGLPGPVPAGPVRLPILGGVEFELPDDAFVEQHQGWALFAIDAEYDFYPPNIEVAAAAATVDHESIASAEQLADLLVDVAGAVRLPDAEIAGRPAVGVEMLGVQPGIPIFRHVDIPPVPDPGLAAWFTQDYVELWAVDTDEGVLILTAEGEDPEGLDRARELHAAIAETLQVDVGPPGDVSG